MPSYTARPKRWRADSQQSRIRDAVAKYDAGQKPAELLAILKSHGVDADYGRLSKARQQLKGIRIEFPPPAELPINGVHIADADRLAAARFSLPTLKAAGEFLRAVEADGGVATDGHNALDMIAALRR